MKFNEFRKFDGVGLGKLVKQGEVTAKELGLAALEGIISLNHDLNAVTETWFDDYSVGTDRQTQGPFSGVPLLLKDHLIEVKNRY